MRSWLIFLALVALVSANASHQMHRTSQKRNQTLRKFHQRSLRQEHGALGPAACGHLEEEGYSKKQKAAMARYLVHNCLSSSMGTIASLKNFTKYVGNNVQITTDTICGNSTGVPYVYMSENDFSRWDLRKDNHTTMFFSRVVIDDFCKKLPLGPIDPKCARAELVGKMVPVTEDNEKKAAFESLTNTFPGLKNVKHEDYTLCKMEIEAVFVVDHAGNPEQIDIELYKNTKPEEYYLANAGNRRAPARRISRI